MKTKKGFSFGEMLATIIIIGIVSALSIPIISQSLSNQNKSLYRSAFQSVETIVSELVNDVTLYPSGEFSNNTFCSNFFSLVNSIGYSDSNCANNFSSNIPDIPNGETTNGMRWYFLEKDFESDECPDGASGECIKISVDVNGKSGANTTTSGSNRDIFDIYISKDGKVTVKSGSDEADFLLN